MIESYSPNIKWGKQHVEIVLMQWGYSEKFTVDVGGNCTGFDVLGTAIGNLYSKLPETDGSPFVTLKKGDDTLICHDEEERDEDWLKDMVVSCQIVGWTPPTLNEVRAKNGAKPLPDGDVPWHPR